jgi:hypothetical protein
LSAIEQQKMDEMNTTTVLVIAPASLLAAAEEVLLARRPCDAQRWHTVRAIAKALIDETDETTRMAQDHAKYAKPTNRRSVVRIPLQMHTLSPEHTIDKAATVKDILLEDPGLQAKVRQVVNGYLEMADAKARLWDSNFEAFCGMVTRVEVRDFGLDVPRGRDFIRLIDIGDSLADAEG